MGVVSRIAMCFDCDWREESNASSTYHKAQMHAKTHRHKTSVETVTCRVYDFREERGKVL